MDKGEGRSGTAEDGPIKAARKGEHREDRPHMHEEGQGMKTDQEDAHRTHGHEPPSGTKTKVGGKPSRGIPKNRREKEPAKRP